ncbi:hypothetical protein GGI25_003055 [Coemansia spiralis]|uniref:Uncharacterized protein n=2 Tax=Coemansia TaxID=4863 RepID=A0A9W8G730_9FUNG|nr:hypothetical protein EDC05_001514 [Coemansia umbellata]KAJ2624403.1 hypothetical protein GGI26_001538 [Coemansia sp. RSA 1358]KAJ2677535.1 hypothetical protein GGI25_003055 [Coemansia spiralis]
MATLSATGASATASSATPSSRTTVGASETSMLSAGLVRCRRWLRHQRNSSSLTQQPQPASWSATSFTAAAATSDCSDHATLQNSTADLPSINPSNSSSNIAITHSSSSSHATSTTTAAAAAAAATAAACPPGGSAQLLHLMNGRWSGCLAPTISSRSLSSRSPQHAGIRSRASALLRSESTATAAIALPHQLCPSQRSAAAVRDSLLRDAPRSRTPSHSTSSIHSNAPRTHDGQLRRPRATGPDIGLAVPTAIMGGDNILALEQQQQQQHPHVLHPIYHIPQSAAPISPVSMSLPDAPLSDTLPADVPVPTHACSQHWECSCCTDNVTAEEPEPLTPTSTNEAKHQSDTLRSVMSHNSTHDLHQSAAEPNTASVHNCYSHESQLQQHQQPAYHSRRASSSYFSETGYGLVENYSQLRNHSHNRHRRRHRHQRSFSGNISAETSDAGDGYDSPSISDSDHEIDRINRISTSARASTFNVVSNGDDVAVASPHDSAYGESGLASNADIERHVLENASSAMIHPMHAPQPHNGNASTGMPSASAIANIFSIGQPAQQRKKLPKSMSRARRASRCLLALLTKALHFEGIKRSIGIGSRSHAGNNNSTPLVSDNDRECSDALAAAFTTESSLVTSIQFLERMRSTRSPSFRMRADRVHLAQSQLLHCIYMLFIQQIPVEQRQSRHYRFYLPEDDQMELDRGFSESVLFAAQALSRGFQIRGTETYTQALREPAWMLCSVWAAVRHVMHIRGPELWRIWMRGTSMSDGTVDEELSQQEGLAALRRVLEDFDEAWVRFERDLCFAYFGLSNSQIAGIMDPNYSGDGIAGEGLRIAQEEEFSLLVVLLSETLQRCLAQKLTTQDQMEAMDPMLVLALPRLAILHAIAHGGVEGLSFVESDGAPMFWWFRDYKDICKQISDIVSKLPSGLYDVLQQMLIAEEADVVLSQTSDSLFADKVDYKKQCETEHKPTAVVIVEGDKKATPASNTASTAFTDDKIGECNCAGRRKTLDLESIIDSPRTTRSLSIDDCISSMYLAPPRLNSGNGIPVTTTAEAVAAAAAARSRASSMGCLVCAMPDPECMTSRLNLACEKTIHRGRAVSSASSPFDSMGCLSNEMLIGVSPSSTMSSPMLNGCGSFGSPGCYNCIMATPASLMPPQALTLNRTDSKNKEARDAERKAKVDLCKTELKGVFVNVCTVADSLHSGSFARPFRVALELVFRMNISEDEA